ncbi:hypothetical protein H1B27_30960 [Bradyrhizobium sp. CNPSo 4019]|uniref:Transposase n=1 Tax=Bradyrhizobium diversitatis TaxID=2755406 RepID=A0ABS0PCB3_9BRAD|nr:hypothetical protein [Bradyrhizobium diversitatis]
MVEIVIGDFVVRVGSGALYSSFEKSGQDKPKRAPRPRKEFGAHLERVVRRAEVPLVVELWIRS